ncbi:MAG: DUF86 domain-containing protein [Candidatus Hatepunaea meridiana]|nr:DUF86 domain-containing protein [Candidatus Hatepunaea meridiana]
MKDDIVYFKHMFRYAQKAIEITGDKSRFDYDNDLVLRLALTHLVQIVGEAASLVSIQKHSEYPDIPWKNIIGMRHRIVHNYINIKYEVVWKVVTEELPLLVGELEKIILLLE